MLFQPAKQKCVNLALQGGGAHGAFTWGVLDYLLEYGKIGFEGVSGTSAGAMNAVVLANGLMQGGIDGGRKALRDFWTAVAAGNPFARVADTVSPTPMKMMLQWTQYFSPDQLNPLDFDPLRQVAAEQIDFDGLRRHSPVKLFIAATHANSGKLRIFRDHEISVDALLASACLPTIHKAVVIDGEPYWDGGYSANPAIFPLFFDCECHDILLVLLTPIEHKRTPASAAEIKDRTLDISFNAAFLREMQSFVNLRNYFARNWPPLGRLEWRSAHTYFHLIEAEDLLGDMGVESKLSASMKFFEKLHDYGRQRAREWIEAHSAKVGKATSANMSLFA